MSEMILLDETGHSEFSWTPDSDDVMIEFIENKMKNGVVFFILEQRFILPDKKKQISKAHQSLSTRKVIVNDRDMQKIIDAGHQISTKTSGTEIGNTIGKLTKAKDAIGQRIMGVKKMAGG